MQEQQVRGLFSKEHVSLSQVIRSTFPAASITELPNVLRWIYFTNRARTLGTTYAGSMGWLKVQWWDAHECCYSNDRNREQHGIFINRMWYCF